MGDDGDTQIGTEFSDTEQLSVPQLARHLMDELAWEFHGLWFSATVYRYRVAGPWIVDVEVFGLRDADVDCTEHATQLIQLITDRLDAHNWWTGIGDCRFAGPNVVLLREFEQGDRTPCKVTVRRYYLTQKPRGLWEKVRSLATGWLR